MENEDGHKMMRLAGIMYTARRQAVGTDRTITWDQLKRQAAADDGSTRTADAERAIESWLAVADAAETYKATCVAAFHVPERYAEACSRVMITPRWWLKLRNVNLPGRSNIRDMADLQEMAAEADQAAEFYVPWWAWPLEWIHRLVFGRHLIDDSDTD